MSYNTTTSYYAITCSSTGKYFYVSVSGRGYIYGYMMNWNVLSANGEGWMSISTSSNGKYISIVLQARVTYTIGRCLIAHD
jgi:hypothetical protein